MIRFFDHGTDLTEYLFAVSLQVQSEYFNGTGCGTDQGHHHAQGGGFTRTVLTEKTVDLSSIHFKGNIAYGFE
jgi:hypothetical protein